MELAIAFAIAMLILLVSLARLPGLWRGERQRELERTLSWLPFGPRFRQGMIRVQPALAVGVVFLLATST